MNTAEYNNRPIFLLWSEIEKWTPTSSLLRFGTLPDGWKILSVSAFATQIEKKERVVADAEYKMAGVKWYGEGIFHRETVLGNEQSASYLHPLIPRSIIYNRLFAWKESFAVVPKEFSGFHVSNEFPQFEINERIALPEYVYLLFITKKIINAVNASSIGSAAVSRNRFKESDFLNFKVPIPPLPVQRKIVEHWEKTQEKIANINLLIEQVKASSFNFFRECLGIKISKNKCNKFFVALWSQIDRWGNEFVWQNKTIKYSFAFPVKPLHEICKTGSGGTPKREFKDYYGGHIPWVKTTEVKNNIILDTEEKITNKGLDLSSAKIYPAGSLIIAMYGQGATRGRTAKLGIDAATNQACLVITDIDNSLDTDFLWYYLMVSYNEIRKLASGNNQPNLSAELLGNFLVPIPPKEKQEELKIFFRSSQEKLSELEFENSTLLNKSIQQIEQMILGTVPL